MPNEPAVCPTCLRVILDTEDKVEFSEFPGVPFHAACIDRKGVGPTLAVLRERFDYENLHRIPGAGESETNPAQMHDG